MRVLMGFMMNVEADTDDKTHVPTLNLQSKHVLPGRPQSVHASGVTGPHQIARNHAPQIRHTAAPGRHPAEQPPRVLLTHDVALCSTHGH